MKIIFLDIDGVLCVMRQEHDDFGQLFHEELVDNLKRIIDETGAKIVISSSWRKSGLDVIKEMWEKRNLPGEIIDSTPGLYVFKDSNNIQFFNGQREQKKLPRFHGYSIPRGSEIEYWLDDNSGKHIIDSYVIIDDDTDMLLSQKDKFVQCSGNLDHQDCIDCGYGLTKLCADKAIQILNKK